MIKGTFGVGRRCPFCIGKSVRSARGRPIHSTLWTARLRGTKPSPRLRTHCLRSTRMYSHENPVVKDAVLVTPAAYMQIVGMVQALAVGLLLDKGRFFQFVE